MTPSSVTLVPDPAVAGKTFVVTVPGDTGVSAPCLASTLGAPTLVFTDVPCRSALSPLGAQLCR